MHEKLKKEGLVVITVTVDDPKNDEAVENVKKFLERIKAGGLTNLLLDEPAEVWTEKLGTPSVPCVYVFNREGRIAQKWTEEFTAEELDKIVADLLKK